MLSKQALQTSVPLAEVLESARVYVEPAPGSLLEALVQATRTPFGGMDPNYVPSIEDVEYLANAQDSTTGICQHDMVMDEIAQKGILGVQALITHARTVVAPAVIALVKKVEAELENTTKSALGSMEVISVHYPAVVYVDSFKKEVRKYDETAFDDPDLAMRCPTIATSDIRELMKTGAGQADGAVEEWLASKGESFLIDVWENIFQIKQSDMNETTTRRLRSYIDNPEGGLDWAIAVYLIARKLIEQGPLDNTDMALPRFESLMGAYRDQAALALCRELDKLETATKTGRLVIRATEQKVWVDSAIYDAWLEAGGEIEVLYGNLLDGNNRLTTQQLDEGAAYLKTLWMRHESITKVADENKRFSRALNFIDAYFRASVAEMTDEERLKVTPEAVMNIFVQELRKVQTSDLDCLYTTCLKLVCRARFPYSDAEELLANSTAIQKKNPTMDPAEAMLMANLQYVAKWMTEQFVVKPMNPI